jgi:hypothetical protein
MHETFTSWLDHDGLAPSAEGDAGNGTRITTTVIRGDGGRDR